MATDSTQGKEFLGAGLAFPLEIDYSGQMKLNRIEDHVRQSILLILQTDKGERVMRPDFGAGMRCDPSSLRSQGSVRRLSTMCGSVSSNPPVALLGG